LIGEQIPLQAKIVSVADTFDAMTIDRPYSKALPLETALTKIKEMVGSRYDEGVVEALIAACRFGEVANGVVRQRTFNRDAFTDLSVDESQQEELLEIPIIT
jgi:HD-GYP domain-containing protein (c-di-GMP phosphodiesterase class II)